MKCESVILDLKLRRWKEVRCGQVQDELARGARSSCVSSKVELRRVHHVRARCLSLGKHGELANQRARYSSSG